MPVGCKFGRELRKKGYPFLRIFDELQHVSDRDEAVSLARLLQLGQNPAPWETVEVRVQLGPPRNAIRRLECIDPPVSGSQGVRLTQQSRPKDEGIARMIEKTLLLAPSEER